MVISRACQGKTHPNQTGTHSKPAVIDGVLTMAIADAFSDALGIHTSEESENKHTRKEIWESTISTFLSKFIFLWHLLFPSCCFNFQQQLL